MIHSKYIKKSLDLNTLLLSFLPICLRLLFLRHINAIADIPLMHAPIKKTKENPNAIFLPNHPQIFKLIILSHIPQVILYKIVDVFTEDIHVALGQQLPVVLRIYDELEEEHEEEVEGLEDAPAYAGADWSSELEEAIGYADVALDEDCRAHAGVQVDIHLWEDLNFVQVGFVEVLLWHL